jgi:hypothetical protein
MMLTRRQFTAGAAALDAPRAAPGFARLVPERLSRTAVFEKEGWHLWDPAMVRTGDGLCHLLFSRWPEKLGFDGWATHAEIAWATARAPEGPYQFQKAVLCCRGRAFWDGHSVYNACLLAHGGKFYLYYTGNRGAESWRPDRALTMKDPDWWTQRNNQRIGVAVAEHPSGPWRRFDQPLIDTGPETGQGITAVPNITPRAGGGFLLAYKTLAPGPGNFGGGVFHYVATGGHPLGPFRRHPVPMVDKSKVFPRHFNFHIDDHFEWLQDGRYYAIVKDHDAPYLTPYGRCLYLLESDDGLAWRTARNALVKDFSITWDDGVTQRFERLEMPKLYLEQGRPRTLLLAAKLEDQPAARSFLIVMPLRQEPL